MVMNPVPIAVKDYAQPRALPTTENRDMRSMKQRLGDTHKEAVSAGFKGPIILLGAFVSSTLVLLYQGAQYVYHWLLKR